MISQRIFALGYATMALAKLGLSALIVTGIFLLVSMFLGFLTLLEKSIRLIRGITQ